MFKKVIVKCDIFDSFLELDPAEAGEYVNTEGRYIWIAWNEPAENRRDMLRLDTTRLRTLGQKMIDIANELDGEVKETSEEYI